jgi:uncharacterized protein
MDQKLLEILVCPRCGTGVRLEGDRLVCTDCGRRYPVRDGIPVMIVEEADPPAGRDEKIGD